MKRWREKPFPVSAKKLRINLCGFTLLRDRTSGETIAAPGEPFFFRRIKEDQHWHRIAANGGCLHDALLCFSTSVEKTPFVRASNSKSPEFVRQAMPVAIALLCDRNEIAEIR